MKNIPIIAIFLLTSVNANAQSFSFNSGDNLKHHVYLETGVEYGLITKTGYALKTILFKQTVIWSTDITIPFLKFDFHDYKLKSGIQIPVVSKKDWITSVNANIIFRGVETNYNTSTNLGYEIGIKSGLYKNKWFVAAESGFDHALATHIANSDYYKTFYYNDAKDGWYSNTDGNIYFGVSCGYTLQKSDITLRLGKVVDRKFSSPTDFSAYFVLGYHLKF